MAATRPIGRPISRPSFEFVGSGAGVGDGDVAAVVGAVVVRCVDVLIAGASVGFSVLTASRVE